MVLAFRFAQIFSQEFAKVFNQELFPLYSTLSFWRYLTGYFPNFFQVDWRTYHVGIYFFSSWLMLWRFDSFFANAKKIQDEEVHEKKKITLINRMLVKRRKPFVKEKRRNRKSIGERQF